MRFAHIIPRGLLAEILLDETPDNLGGFLDSYFRAAVLTVEEDHQLNAAGVRGRMPAGWHFGDDDDPWERYRQGRTRTPTPSLSLWRRCTSDGESVQAL